MKHLSAKNNARMGVLPEASDEPPLISCVMPTYDRRPFIPLALECFLLQDYPRKELLILDDGTDPVEDLIPSLPAIRYVRLNHRHTIGSKRNLACAAACGELVAHWDDDDWYAPDRLSLQAAAIVAGEADLTGMEARYFLELRDGTFWRSSEALHRRMFVGNVHGGTLMLRRSILSVRRRYADANLAEEVPVIRQSLQRGLRLQRITNEGTFVYMRHSRNAWRFQSGAHMDPDGWSRTEPPYAFTETLYLRYREAAAALTCGRRYALASQGTWLQVGKRPS